MKLDGRWLDETVQRAHNVAAHLSPSRRREKTYNMRKLFEDDNIFWWKLRVEPLCHGSRSLPTRNPDIYIFNQF